MKINWDKKGYFLDKLEKLMITKNNLNKIINNSDKIVEYLKLLRLMIKTILSEKKLYLI